MSSLAMKAYLSLIQFDTYQVRRKLAVCTTRCGAVLSQRSLCSRMQLNGPVPQLTWRVFGIGKRSSVCSDQLRLRAFSDGWG